MTLGERIYKKRKEIGLTQEALAEKLEVTGQAVSKWENDATCPDISLLSPLARILGMTVDELLANEDEPTVYVNKGEKKKSIDDMILRINVNDGGDKTKVNLPLVLVRAIVSAAPDSFNLNFGKSDLKLDWKTIISLIESGVVGKIVEVEGADGESIVVEVI